MLRQIYLHEVYYQRAPTAPFLDHLLQEMEDTFSTNAKVETLGLCSVPIVRMIGRIMPKILYHSTKVIYFHCKLSCTVGNTNVKTDDLPDGFIDALNKCA